QGQQGSNPRPTVLESVEGAYFPCEKLPIESLQAEMITMGYSAFPKRQDSRESHLAKERHLEISPQSS
ncbi:hypothetical protein VK682_27205, partial [Salipiger manganoxidans]|uniref:hypothetical protein n=1 Tax=Salipiger marinus TaxID=555512 RepID=UPI002CFF7E74